MCDVLRKLTIRATRQQNHNLYNNQWRELNVSYSNWNKEPLALQKVVNVFPAIDQKHGSGREKSYWSSRTRCQGSSTIGDPKGSPSRTMTLWSSEGELLTIAPEAVDLALEPEPSLVRCRLPDEEPALFLCSSGRACCPFLEDERRAGYRSEVERLGVGLLEELEADVRRSEARPRCWLPEAWVDVRAEGPSLEWLFSWLRRAPSQRNFCPQYRHS